LHHISPNIKQLVILYIYLIDFYLKHSLHYILCIVEWVETPFYIRQQDNQVFFNLENATAHFLGRLILSLIFIFFILQTLLLIFLWWHMNFCLTLICYCSFISLLGFVLIVVSFCDLISIFIS